MFINPGGITLAELSSAFRDVTIIGVLLSVGWKGRALIQPVVQFFTDAKKFFGRANEHMTIMESGMHALLTNHLAHLKKQEENSAGEVS